MNLRNHKLHELMNKKFQYLFYLLDSTFLFFLLSNVTIANMNQSMASYLKQMKFVLIIIKQEIKIPKLKNKNKIALF